MKIINPEEKSLISTLGLVMSKKEASKMIEELELLIHGKGNYIISFDKSSKGNGSSGKQIKIFLYDSSFVEKMDEKTKNLIKYGKL